MSPCINCCIRWLVIRVCFAIRMQESIDSDRKVTLIARKTAPLEFHWNEHVLALISRWKGRVCVWPRRSRQRSYSLDDISVCAKSSSSSVVIADQEYHTHRKVAVTRFVAMGLHKHTHTHSHQSLSPISEIIHDARATSNTLIANGTDDRVVWLRVSSLLGIYFQ